MSDILVREGENAARAREQAGILYGGAVSGLGQVPSQVFAAEREAKDRAIRNQIQGQQLQLGQQELELGQGKILAQRQAQQAMGITSKSVQAHTTMDPETGHRKTDHAAVVQDLMDAGLPDHANAYSTVSTAIEDRNSKMQSDYLATQEKIRTHNANILGSIASLPEEKQPAAWQATRASLAAGSPDDPTLKIMPETYPGADGLKQLHQGQLSEAERMSRAKDASTQALQAAETKKNEAEAKKAEAEAARGPQPTEASLAADLASTDPKVQARAKTAMAALQAPRLAAEAETRRHNLAEEKLKGTPGADDLGVQTDIRTTSTGRTYLDSSKYKGKDFAAARAQAHATGAYFASAPEADALQNIGTARENMGLIASHLEQLPSNALSRAAIGPLNLVKAGTQWDENLASWGTWRTAAIEAMRALAGSKGLRINRAEIEASVENDIPRITDTLPTAKAKLKKVDQMLKSQEDGVMGGQTAPKEIVYDANLQPIKP